MAAIHGDYTAGTAGGVADGRVPRRRRRPASRARPLGPVHTGSRRSRLATLEAVLAVFVGLVLAFVLAWLILSGVLSATFKRARTVLRRAIERRRAARPGAAERRASERRRT